MDTLCEDLKNHVQEIVRSWQELVEKQPWFLQPKDSRTDTLPLMVLELVNAALCDSTNEEAHRRQVLAAAELGWMRRESELPEHVMFTEFHVLRQAIWYYLDRRHGPSDLVSHAIFRIDAAITLAINASLWGYHRAEIEALGKWDEGIHRIVRSSPFLGRGRRKTYRVAADETRNEGAERRPGEARHLSPPETGSGRAASAGPTIPHAIEISDDLSEPPVRTDVAD